MNTDKAIQIAEGFGEGESATEKEKIEAWCYLIKTGICWQLNMWYGRTAKDYINNGIINENGKLLKNILDENTNKN